MSFMLEEIREQPGVISALSHDTDTLFPLVSEVKRRAPGLIVLAARGTSDNAALYGKYMFELMCGMPVMLADPSVFTLYDGRIDLQNAFVIGVSQSGEATDVCMYLEKSRDYGAFTAAITNEEASAITRSADHTIFMQAGKENAVAATKTYTATLGIFYLLASLLADRDGAHSELARASEEMEKVVQAGGYIEERAERYRYMQNGACIGRGINYATALECALKLAETSYVGFRGYSAADFMHGPIASVHEGDPCVLLAAEGKAMGSVMDTLKRLASIQAETIVISASDEALESACVPVKLPVSVSEELSPIVYIVAGQLLAYYISVARGNNPDNPKGLSKVTLTK